MFIRGKIGLPRLEIGREDYWKVKQKGMLMFKHSKHSWKNKKPRNHYQYKWSKIKLEKMKQESWKHNLLKQKFMKHCWE